MAGARPTAWTSCSAWPATIGSSRRSPTSWPQAKATSRRPASRRACFKDFSYRTRNSWRRSRRVVAKAETGQGRQSALRRHLARRPSATAARISTRRSTAPAATWRTASRSASSISLPIAPRPPPCGPTSCACGSPRWPMCCSAPCAASGCRHRARQSDLRHHPPQAAQDRRPRARQRPPHQDRLRLRLSGQGAVRHRRRATARLGPANRRRGLTPPRPLKDQSQEEQRRACQNRHRRQRPRPTASNQSIRSRLTSTGWTKLEGGVRNAG